MDIQVGDVVRINESGAAFSIYSENDICVVTDVRGHDGRIKAMRNGACEQSFLGRHYDLIARAVKPDTGETVQEMATRLCKFRECKDCPISPRDASMCAVYLARQGLLDRQLAELDAWGLANSPTPKPVNRVLTMCEVYALPEGAEVYVEERGGMYPSTVAKREGTAFKDGIGRYDMNQLSYYIENNKLRMRFWLLPQPPTEAEKAANPW